MAQCPDCMADNPESTKFCKRCGCPLPASPLPVPSVGPAALVPGAVCPKCADGLPPGVKFCTACGRMPDTSPPPSLATPPVTPLVAASDTEVGCDQDEPGQAGVGARDGAGRSPGVPAPLLKKPCRMRLVLILLALGVVCAAIGSWSFFRSVQPAADAANATQNATGNAADTVTNGTSVEALKPVPSKPTPSEPVSDARDIKEPKPKRLNKKDLGNHVPLPPKGDEKLNEIEREREKLLKEMKLNKL